MADDQGVWGIDIGQAGLKAIRLRYAEAAKQVVAVAFDYVPHPKILSQPDAIPEEIIPASLEKFLSRNDLSKDNVVISVPGQTALSRFVHLPPVPQAKVAEIVKYEARQTIPFALEDVIWDYQVLSAGSEESDFLLDAEVGLFAMKRDEVENRLQPFIKAKVEVDSIQIAPMALHNTLSYDLMGIRKEEAADPDTEEHTIILDMGCDNTTLVVTNGAKIWIRNVPIGGNHFTRALTKEMKLTFAKAEHLKCNATKSEDPRAVFQALRPVFNDYVSEIQRSIGYFSSVNRNAKLKKVVGVGNGFKLAGLQKFLQQNLQYDVVRLGKYESLLGDAVLSAPLFEENLLTFAVPYGLALQGLELTKVHTSLLPPEIVTERKIRAKKPWAAVAAAAVLLGVTLSGVGNARVARSVSEAKFGDAEQQVATFKSKVGSLDSGYKGKVGEHEGIMKKGQVLIDTLDSRTRWLEVYKAINSALPRDQGDVNEDEIEKLNRVMLKSITAERVGDVSVWYESLSPTAVQYLMDEDKKKPEGEGYVFTLRGLHYHQDKTQEDFDGILYVRDMFVANLKKWKSPFADVGIREIGITHATITDTPASTPVTYDPNRRKRRAWSPQRGRLPMGGAGPMGTGLPGTIPMVPMGGLGQGRIVRQPVAKKKADDEVSAVRELTQSHFEVQFIWQPIVEKADRELNNIMYEELRANKDASFDDVKKRVDAKNKLITDAHRRGEQLDVLLMEPTNEKFDAFKKKHFEKPEPENEEN